MSAIINPTNNMLEKLENLLKAAGYRVRYEKGNFKTGACLLQNSRIVVVNKFSNVENKVEAIVSLLGTIEIAEYQLDEKQRVLLKQVKHLKPQL